VKLLPTTALLLLLVGCSTAAETAPTETVPTETVAPIEVPVPVDERDDIEGALARLRTNSVYESDLRWLLMSEERLENYLPEPIDGSGWFIYAAGRSEPETNQPWLVREPERLGGWVNVWQAGGGELTEELHVLRSIEGAERLQSAWETAYREGGADRWLEQDFVATYPEGSLGDAAYVTFYRNGENCEAAIVMRVENLVHHARYVSSDCTNAGAYLVAGLAEGVVQMRAAALEAANGL